MPDDTEIKNLEKDKYLGVRESDQMWCREMKSNVTKEYFRRIQDLLKLKLIGGNAICKLN